MFAAPRKCSLRDTFRDSFNTFYLVVTKQRLVERKKKWIHCEQNAYKPRRDGQLRIPEHSMLGLAKHSGKNARDAHKEHGYEDSETDTIQTTNKMSYLND